jgi:hypothetical protein
MGVESVLASDPAAALPSSAPAQPPPGDTIDENDIMLEDRK